MYVSNINYHKKVQKSRNYAYKAQKQWFSSYIECLGTIPITFELKCNYEASHLGLTIFAEYSSDRSNHNRRMTLFLIDKSINSIYYE